MKNNFNLTEYSALLTKDKILLIDEELSKLKSYRTIIEDQVYYNNKSEYQSLITDYLSQKIGSGGFIMTFLKLFGIDKAKHRLMNKDFKKLSVFSIDPQFHNFAAFMSKIFENSILKTNYQIQKYF